MRHLLLLAVAFMSPAVAQTAGSKASEPGLEDIIVTATRRAERLQDVAISVSAFSQAKLDKQALRSIDDLTRFSPGVTFTRNGLAGNYNDSSNSIAIRGIDSSAGAATTGIYIDESPIQSRRIGFGTQNAYPQLFDLDRVEVLRGPQGTLFGAGSQGGTVRFISPSPSLSERSIYARGELAGTTKGGLSAEGGAAFGMPLVNDKVGLRLSGSFRRDGGYVDRINYTPAGAGSIAEDNANWTNTATFRAALKWQVSDALSLTPSFYWQWQRTNDTGAYWSARPALSDPGKSIFINGNRLRNQNRDPFWIAALRADYDLGFADLVSSTSYFRRRNKAESDYTQFDRNLFFGVGVAPVGAAAPVYFTDSQDNFYQEVRLSSKDSEARLSWTVGVFYSRLIENSTEFIYDPTLPAEYEAVYGSPLCASTGVLACPGGLIYSQPIYRVVDKQFAGFGEFKYKITDTISAVAGVRVSDVRYNTISDSFGVFFGGRESPTESGGETPVTPRFSLNFQPDRDKLFYASVAKGFRVGGTNTPLGNLCAADLAVIGIANSPRTYNSDTLWSYEAGAKITAFDRRVTINGSAYLIDWSNIQQNVYLPSCGLQYTDNLGKVRSVGGDLEISARVSDALSLGLTVAYNDAYYTRNSGGTAPGTSPVVSKGDRLRGAPWSLVASAEYRFGPDARRSPFVRLDYQYSSKLNKLNPQINPANATADPTLSNLPSTENLNLRLGYTLGDAELSVFAQNLTNDLPVLYNNRDVGYTDQYFARSVRPRTFGVTLTFRQ